MTVIGTRDFALSSHLEQSTSSFSTVFLLGSDSCAESENFLHQRDDVAHLRTILRFTHALIIIIIIQ